MIPPETLELLKTVGVIVTGFAAITGALLGLFNKGKIREVHLLMNSRLSELLAATLDKGRILERSEIASGAVASPDTPATRAATEQGAVALRVVVSTAAAVSDKFAAAADTKVAQTPETTPPKA